MNRETRTIIDQAVAVLQAGGLILYPTDTVWGVGCDATNSDAVSRVYDLKQRPDSKALICLVGNERMLNRVIADVPEAARDLMALSQKPVTIVYDNPRGVAPNLIAGDNSLAVRVASDTFCRELLRRFRKPLVSTSANISGSPTPGRFSEIGTAILKGVDYVVPLEQESPKSTPSSIIRLRANGQVQVIRA